MLVLGSSPSIEVVPAFLAAAPLGVSAFVALAVVFSITTIGTYVISCTLSSVGLERFHIPAFERYGEVIAGSLIAGIGLSFLAWF
jgi:tetrahydromethanopterin S-methyltransferase subunit D